MVRLLSLSSRKSVRAEQRRGPRAAVRPPPRRRAAAARSERHLSKRHLAAAGSGRAISSAGLAPAAPACLPAARTRELSGGTLLEPPPASLRRTSHRIAVLSTSRLRHARPSFDKHRLSPSLRHIARPTLLAFLAFLAFLALVIPTLRPPANRSSRSPTPWRPEAASGPRTARPSSGRTSSRTARLPGPETTRPRRGASGLAGCPRCACTSATAAHRARTASTTGTRRRASTGPARTASTLCVPSFSLLLHRSGASIDVFLPQRKGGPAWSLHIAQVRLVFTAHRSLGTLLTRRATATPQAHRDRRRQQARRRRCSRPAAAAEEDAPLLECVALSLSVSLSLPQRLMYTLSNSQRSRSGPGAGPSSRTRPTPRARRPPRSTRTARTTTTTPTRAQCVPFHALSLTYTSTAR